MSRKVLIIGAGASGRGHVGQLALESGYDVTFVEKDRDLVEGLRKSKKYVVHLVSAQPRDFVVDRFEILHLGEPEAVYRALVSSPLIFTVVGPNNLKDVANYLRPMLERWLRAGNDTGGQDSKNVLCCENMDRSSTVFKGMLLEGFPPELAGALDARVGFPDTMIARVVAKPKDPLRLLGEEYSEWTADRKALRGADVPAIKTLEFVDEQARYLQRKLYIHNTGHATLGYLGFVKGYAYIHEAAQDPAILDVTAKAIEESGWAIQKEHGFSQGVIGAYRQALLDKCPCAELPDEITRVVREPLRKLGPAERFFGPVRLLLKHGRKPDYILHGLCAALLADVPGDAESARLRRLMEAGGVRKVLQALEVRIPAEVLHKIESLLPSIREAFLRLPGSAREDSEMPPGGVRDLPGRPL